MGAPWGWATLETKSVSVDVCEGAVEEGAAAVKWQ